MRPAAAPVIFWFRRDLRLSDNPALRAAVSLAGVGGVIPIFVWAPDEDAPFSPGGASRVWLHDSLVALAGSLQALGSRLILRAGPTLETLSGLVAASGARAVFWNRCYEPAAADRDARVDRALRACRIATATDLGLASANLLFEPEALRTAMGTPFQKFTPFWRRGQAALPPPRPLPAPTTLPAPARWPRSTPLAALQLRPAIPWDRGLRAAFRPGEAEAHARLRRFVGNRAGSSLLSYAGGRERPDLDGSSRLSPHLHFGEIGPRQIWHTTEHAARRRRFDAQPFLRQLVWREFAHHVLHHFPATAAAPMRPAFARFPWQHDRVGLRAWQQGRTGYPLVDAGMRELWATGFLPNRVRMVAASFLVKHLLIPWQEGARWFWDTLVDADLADNSLGWQWCAGSGVDAAPFFRIFNPVLQGRSFDPDGAYVRRWVPELRRLPTRYLHAPWAAPADVRTSAGLALGRSYPPPIVDHPWARARALAAFQETKRPGSPAGPRDIRSRPHLRRDDHDLLRHHGVRRQNPAGRGQTPRRRGRPPVRKARVP